MNDRNIGALVDVAEERSPLLDAFGARLRLLRAGRGLTRRELAQASGVSDRYLASLESGNANPSLAVLDQIASGLDCPLAALLGDVTATSPEWILIRDLLDGRDEADLRRARLAIGESMASTGQSRPSMRRIALIGLRGAGKSTLGHLLSEDLDMPLIELSSQIQNMAGHSVAEIHDLYGPNAYRRYERRALEEVLQIYPDVVMAIPGGMVSEPATFGLLLKHCLTVWLRADPEDHMSRVAQQGDSRPMAGNAEAMEDLRRILSVREPFYGKADLTVDTSRQPLAETFRLLRECVRGQLLIADHF